MAKGLDDARLTAVRAREMAAFEARTPTSGKLHARARHAMPDGVPMAWMAGLFRHRPLFVTGGAGSRFTDVDGNSYIDFNLADLSNTAGYGANAISRALAAQAGRGLQFMQPGEDAIAVAEELARRTGLPMWQFTISASSANTEVIRIARAFTGRAKIVLFEGKYHGHIEATMANGGAPSSNTQALPEAMGISPRATADSINVPYNDLQTLARALEQDDVALVMVEPALTNCTLVLPEPNFLEGAYRLTKAAGALFALDETHTWQLAYGGFTRADALSADFVALGKGLGSGAPLGAYGMTAELGAYLERYNDDYIAAVRGLAIGGTTFGSAITMAAARAMLDDIATETGYARMERLGARLADGIDAIIARHSLPWRAFRYGPRSGFCLTPELPRNYHEAERSIDGPLNSALRLYMANRGVWEAISSAGPQASFAHDEADVDRYPEVAGAFIREIAA